MTQHKTKEIRGITKERKMTEFCGAASRLFAGKNRWLIVAGSR